MRNALLLLLLACGACKAPPVIVAVELQTDDQGVAAFARTNGRQTLIAASGVMVGEIIDAKTGVPFLRQEVAAGEVLYVDRDADFKETYERGQPVMPTAVLLFPVPADAERLGISFQVPPP